MIEASNYNIHFGPIHQSINALDLSKYSKLAVLVDDNTGEYCLPALYQCIDQHIHLIQIPSGEEYKNVDTCSHIWMKMKEAGLDRKSCLINLGGGVIGDMGGFCAATYMRGIDYIHIPTTLLSQVDSSVGSKLGVDLNGLKNMIGVFSDPEAVIIDAHFLHTLPYRQLLSGFAEVLKHGIIQDKNLWATTSGADDIVDLDLIDIIEQSVAIKAKIVTQDPYENGLRKILNFGHTIGHAIETHLMKSLNPLLHGEAIAIGMICESYIAHRHGHLNEDEMKEITHRMIHFFGHKPKSINDLETIAALTLHDKKNVNGKILISLPQKIGSCDYDKEVTLDEVKESLIYYKNIEHA